MSAFEGKADVRPERGNNAHDPTEHRGDLQTAASDIG
jgi:hypothetical protein